MSSCCYMYIRKLKSVPICIQIWSFSLSVFTLLMKHEESSEFLSSLPYPSVSFLSLTPSFLNPHPSLSSLTATSSPLLPHHYFLTITSSPLLPHRWGCCGRWGVRDDEGWWGMARTGEAWGRWGMVRDGEGWWGMVSDGEGWWGMVRDGEG